MCYNIISLIKGMLMVIIYTKGYAEETHYAGYFQIQILNLIVIIHDGNIIQSSNGVTT